MLYTIVRYVRPGTPCSHLPGETEVDFTSNEQHAERIAADYNRCVAISGITYRVVPIDADDSPRRVPTDEMRKAVQRAK